ncbi:hypothetical protein B0H17DRAFT_1210383 [Mycena rosella]|uniref:Uncharacterized protein n=1 Tax=Mycena rosella TaxID=1033263 RepID=A0AAD7G7H8_MYCRO|nr:hypothetical protein B0H17DRAFT_1210383 [Mycena rosella]
MGTDSVVHIELRNSAPPSRSVGKQAIDGDLGQVLAGCSAGGRQCSGARSEKMRACLPLTITTDPRLKGDSAQISRQVSSTVCNAVSHNSFSAFHHILNKDRTTHGVNDYMLQDTINPFQELVDNIIEGGVVSTPADENNVNGYEYL